MRTQTPYFRLTTALTTASLVLASVLPVTARAQPAPDPSQSGAAQPDQTQADPPARVGRLAHVTGAVSYHNQGDTQWSPAAMNYPVASGTSYWTEQNAEADLELSASHIALAGGTELDIGTLDASGLQATLTQGKVVLRPIDLAPGETWTLQTPRGTVTLSHPGRYLVAAGDTDAPTIVSVVDGDAQVTGPGLDQTVLAGQAATITGTDSLTASIGPAVQDSFVTGVVTLERPPLPPPARVGSMPPPPVIATMPGGPDLSGYGVWNSNPDYGEVWYPAVDAGWVPYRRGHWAFIAPWGWTWVDDAPWGFAPFHYGRWVELGGRWAWTPGFEHERPHGYPVYAPALVTFIGIGAGVAIGAALAAGSIGWVPLGPREAYHPWYHASPRYLGAVNASHVTNITNVTNVTNFRNRAGATMVPASAMTGSRPIRGVAQPIPAHTLATARPLTGQHPLQPTAATAGVTPVVARHLNLPAAAGAPVHPAAPGPAIRPAQAAHRPGGFPALAPAGHAPGVQAPPAGAARPMLQAPPAGVGHAPESHAAPVPPPAGVASPRVQNPTAATPHFNPPPSAAGAPHGPTPIAPVPHPTAPAATAAPHFASPPPLMPQTQHPVAPSMPTVQHPTPPPTPNAHPSPQHIQMAPPQPAPQQHFQPPPQQHFQPPQPAPQEHFQPPPQPHIQPPPQPAPQVHQAPPQQQQQQHKRPGEN